MKLGLNGKHDNHDTTENHYLVGNGRPFLEVKCDHGVMLTTHPYVVLKSAVSRSYTISPPGACMAVAGQLYIFTSLIVFIYSHVYCLGL
jgi:hypothetical protein